jgi:hypothetical protein
VTSFIYENSFLSRPGVESRKLDAVGYGAKRRLALHRSHRAAANGRSANAPRRLRRKLRGHCPGFSEWQSQRRADALSAGQPGSKQSRLWEVGGQPCPRVRHEGKYLTLRARPLDRTPRDEITVVISPDSASEPCRIYDIVGTQVNALHFEAQTRFEAIAY